MGCAVKTRIVTVREPYPVYVPTPDCDNIQLLQDATDICRREATTQHIGVNGLCQFAIDFKKLDACLKNMSETLAQEVLDCRAKVDTLKKVDGN